MILENTSHNQFFFHHSPDHSIYLTEFWVPSIILTLVLRPLVHAIFRRRKETVWCKSTAASYFKQVNPYRREPIINMTTNPNLYSLCVVYYYKYSLLCDSLLDNRIKLLVFNVFTKLLECVATKQVLKNKLY